MNHLGPLTPTHFSSALTAPLPWKRKRKTVDIAIELVTEGKKKAVRSGPLRLSLRLLTASARPSARTVWSGTTSST